MMKKNVLKPKPYIEAFEKLGFGLFVHYGLYSQNGLGEWSMHLHHIPLKEYERLTETFLPKTDWAKELARTAKKAGCGYVTLTTRHHDGFSLYDTCGLNDYDAPHTCGRDLVKEFVEACRAEGLVPFFYHTLLDWREESYQTDFKQYLVYLRKSVELLCTRYGEIGGIWFDGMWDKPNEDWEEDALYGMIRKLQPNAMIINNTGLSAQGALGHILLDSVTFERGKPMPVNTENAPRYVASETCQTLNTHWGYAKNDFKYVSLASIIEDWCTCRKYASNFLLNVGPLGDGSLRALDTALLGELGNWSAVSKEALYTPKPCDVVVLNKEKDFILRGKDAYYMFCYDLPMRADPNVELERENAYTNVCTLKETITEITWLDAPQTKLAFTQTAEETVIRTQPFDYGANFVVRIAKIKTETDKNDG